MFRPVNASSLGRTTQSFEDIKNICIIIVTLPKNLKFRPSSYSKIYGIKLHKYIFIVITLSVSYTTLIVYTIYRLAQKLLDTTGSMLNIEYQGTSVPLCIMQCVLLLHVSVTLCNCVAAEYHT